MNISLNVSMTVQELKDLLLSELAYSHEMTPVDRDNSGVLLSVNGENKLLEEVVESATVVISAKSEDIEDVEEEEKTQEGEVDIFQIFDTPNPEQ